MGDLAAFLAAVRARLRLRLAAESGALGFALCALGLLVVLLAAGLLGPSLLWRSLGAAVLVAALVATVRTIARPLLSWRRDEEVARFIDAATGSSDLVLSALEIGRTLPSLAESGTSPELARALIALAVERCHELSLPKLVDLGRARRRAFAAAAVLALWATGIGLFPGALSRGFLAMASTELAIEAASEPILADLELQLTYPKHTGLPPRDIPGSSGEVLAPPGTTVAVKARPLVPARTAELLVEDAAGKLLASRVVDLAGGRLASSFTVGVPGGYRFAIHPPSGRSVREADPHRIDIEADRAPRVDLAAPADDLEVPGPRKIELAYSVDDDYGLTALELVWRPAGERNSAVPEQRKAVRAKLDGRSTSGKLEWDLAELDLKPGVRVAYHLEAKDNDDVSGPNVGSSRTLYVRVYSPTEKHEELLASEQQLVDHAVVLLADRIDGERNAQGDGDAAREGAAWSTLHGKSEAFLGELGRVAADLDKDKLAPKDLRPALAGIHERIARLDRDEEAPLRDKKKLALRALRDGNPRHVVELERDTLLLDDLISRQRLEALLAVGDEMARARDRLKSLLEQYKKSRSEALRKDIEREIHELERQLAELAEKASRLQGEIPDEFLNREALGDNDMGKRLDTIRQLLEKGDVDQAMAELNRLSQSIDKMMSSMEQDLRGFRNERFSAEEKALSELENKLADLEHDERQIQSDTEEVRAAQKQRAQQMMKDRVEPFLKRARAAAAEMKRKLGEIEPQTLQPYDHEQLERARRRVEDLGHALEQGDLDQARQMARESSDNLRGLGFELKDEEQRTWEGMRAALRKARDRVDESGAIARKLAEEIDQVFPKPGELLGPGDKKKLDELRSRQSATHKRTDEAKKELDQRGPAPRGKGADGEEPRRSAADGLKQAGDHMRRAEDSLGEGDPRDSVGEEGQAADQLHQLRKQVQQQRRPQQDGGGGSMSRKETVKIPGADEYRGPQEFRRDLLDAMKREAPKDFEEQVKRYYEELAR